MSHDGVAALLTSSSDATSIPARQCGVATKVNLVLAIGAHPPRGGLIKGRELEVAFQHRAPIALGDLNTGEGMRSHKGSFYRFNQQVEASAASALLARVFLGSDPQVLFRSCQKTSVAKALSSWHSSPCVLSTCSATARGSKQGSLPCSVECHMRGGPAYGEGFR